MAVRYYILGENLAFREVPESPGEYDWYPISANVVFQMDVAASVNEAGISYRELIKDDLRPRGEEAFSLIPNLETKHPSLHSALQDGKKYEVQETVNYDDAYLDETEREAKILERAAEVEEELVLEQKRLQWAGHTGAL